MKPRYMRAALRSFLKPQQYTLVPNHRHTPLKFVVGGGGDDTTSSSDNKGSIFSDTPNTTMARDDLSSRWVPPTSVNKDNDYHSSIPKKDGYL